MNKINKPASELTIEELQEEYLFQYERTTGRKTTLHYKHGWFVLDNRSPYRADELRRMTVTLRERPTKA